MVDAMHKEALQVEMICVNKKMQERSVRRPSELEGTQEIHWGHVRDIWEDFQNFVLVVFFSDFCVLRHGAHFRRRIKERWEGSGVLYGEMPPFLHPAKHVD